MERSFSVVIPAYNEAENIGRLHGEVKRVCEALKIPYEIILVDDGSSDSTEAVCAKLQPIVYVKMRRNFGQTAAMDAGIKIAKNNYIVTMDGDGQNDPADIPHLLEQLEAKDLDVVSGWRKNRKDPFSKRFISRGANFIRKFLINDEINDSGCSLKIYKRECFQNLNLFGEMHRFVPAILKNRGFKVGEAIVNHRPRTAGVTKYNWRRTIKGLLDMISIWFWDRYAVRPIHLLGVVAALMFALGVIVTIVGITFYIKEIALFSKVLPMVAVFLYLSSLQFLMFGLFGDMLSKNFFSSANEKSYHIKKIINSRGDQSNGKN